MRTLVRMTAIAYLCLGVVLHIAPAEAADVPQSFTLDGQLFSDAASTRPLTDGNIGFKVQVLDEDQICVLYEETQNISTLASNGYFSVQIGTAIGSVNRTPGDSANSMATVFQNISTVNGKLLSTGAPCTAGAVAGRRRFVRVSISPSTMGGTARTLSPDVTIDSVPNSIVAERAESLQGLRASNVLQVNTAAGSALSQSNLESLFTSTTRFNSLTSVIDGTSTNYMRSNSGSGAQLPVLPGAPTTPPIGAIWFDSTDSRIKFQTSVGPASVGTGGGSVTSVGFTAPSELAVSGAPVTSTGTIAVTWAAQTTGKVFASPDGSTGTPMFRSLVAADAPFAIQNLGGTPSFQSGLNAAKGLATTAGRIWISTDTREIYRDTGSAWEAIGSAAGGAPSGAASGDLSGSYPGPTVAKIQGIGVSVTAPLDGQVLKYASTGTTWAPANFNIGDLKTTSGTQQFAGSATCTASQTLTWSSLTDTFVCSNIAGLDGGVITAGTVPAARLPASASAWTVSGADLYRTGGNVGVGVGTPSYALDVQSPSTASGDVYPLRVARSGYDGLGIPYGNGLLFTDLDSVQGGIVAVRRAIGTDYSSDLVFNLNSANGSMLPTTALAERMRLTNEGHLGIGTTPTTRLDINGGVTYRGLATGSAPAPTASQGKIYFDSTLGKFRISENNGAYVDLVAGTPSGGAGDFLADGSVPMTGALQMGGNTVHGNSTASGSLTLDSTSNAAKGFVNIAPSGGNVGIGTTNPGRSLQIDGFATENNDSRESLLLFDKADSSIGNTGGGIGFGGFTNFTNGPAVFAGIKGIKVGGTPGPADGALVFTTSRYNGTNYPLVEAMRINSSGNLGLGTNSPNARLQVVGPNGYGGAPSAIAASGGSSTGGVTGNGGGFTFNGGNGDVAGTGGSFTVTAGNGGSSGDGGEIRLNPGAKGASGVDGNVILANLRGKVGIGTPTPNNALHVSGNGDLTGVEIQNSQTSGVSYSIISSGAGSPLGVGVLGISDGLDYHLTMKDGKVGIGGIYNPRLPFHAYRGAAGVPATSGSTQANGITRFQSSVGSLDFGQLGSGAQAFWIQATNQNNLSVNFPIALAPNGGNVGIGVAGPTSKLQVAGDITPDTTATKGLGTSSLRWSNIYLSNAPDVSSDARLKKNIETSDLGLDFINSLRAVSWVWRDPNQGTTKHYGVIAQEAESAIAKAQGHDSQNVIVTHDEKTDSYSVRYTELIAPLIKAIQELSRGLLDTHTVNEAQDRKIATLEAENADLKARLEKIEERLK